MKYIRTKDGRIGKFYQDQSFTITCSLGCVDKENILNQADTIEELIQLGDVVFYWSPSDDKEHCVVMTCDTELHSIKYNAITKLLIPVGEDYRFVAKGVPSFNLIKGRRYLVNKGELELI